MHEQLDQIDFPLTEPTPDDSPPPDVDLARIGPLRVVLEEVVDEGGEAGLMAAVLQVIPDRILGPPESGLPTPIRWVGYTNNSRCILCSSSKCDDALAVHNTALTHMPAGHSGSYIHACRSLRLLRTCLQVVTALMHLSASHYSSYTHVCRSLRPAQDAASVLQRYKQENPTSKLGMQDAHPESQAHVHDGEQQQGICIDCSYFACRLRAGLGSVGDVCTGV